MRAEAEPETAPARPGLVALAILALAYVIAGKLGLRLAFVHASATAVWPPAGIALYAFLFFGRRAWPAIFLAAFLVNETTAGSIGTSLAIAAGNTLEGLIGAALVAGFARGPRAFERPKDVVRFAIMGAVVSTTVAAVVGVTSLCLGGFAAWSRWGTIALTWWLGDVAGALIVAPLLVLWSRPSETQWTAARVLEAALLLVGIVLVGQVVFGGWTLLAKERYPLEFLIVPLLVWSAFRFGPRETATATFVLAAVAVVGTLQGFGPFARETPNVSLLLLQAFLAVSAVLALALAAALVEQRRSSAAVRSAEEQVRQLDRERAQEALRMGEAALAEAQALAHIGSWSWDVASDKITWSDELYRIYGLTPQSARPLSYGSFLDAIHPDDRRQVADIVEASSRSGEPFTFEHRIVRPDGTQRWVQGRGRVAMAEGKPVRMFGTSQDVTERKLAERIMRDFIANAAHELRTPLTTMAGIADLLSEFRSSLSEAQIADHYERLRRQANRARRLISSLLDLSRMEQGLLGVELHQVHLAPLARHAADVAPAPAGVSLRVDVAPAMHARADPMRLEEILVNLLTNAYHYGGSSVGLEATAAPGGVRVAVWDDGAGVPEELVPSLFDPFTRGVEHQKTEGSGLGLTISRRLARAMGGDLCYEPRRPRGACFVLRLNSVA